MGRPYSAVLARRQSCHSASYHGGEPNPLSCDGFLGSGLDLPRSTRKGSAAMLRPLGLASAVIAPVRSLLKSHRAGICPLAIGASQMSYDLVLHNPKLSSFPAT